MRIILVLLFTLAITPFCHSIEKGVLPERPMTFVFSDNYPPFSWKNEEGKVTGVLPSYLEAILGEMMGVKLNFEVYPWSRGQLYVEEGVVDALFTIPTEKRRTYTEISQYPLFVSDFYIYTGVNNPNRPILSKVRNLKELKAYESLLHVYIHGSGWHGASLAGVKNWRTVDNSTHIINLLFMNRVDVYLEQSVLMNYQVRLLGFEDKIVEISTSMGKTSWHLCIGKKSPFTKILPELNQLMKRLNEDGSLETIKIQIFNQYQ